MPLPRSPPASPRRAHRKSRQPHPAQRARARRKSQRAPRRRPRAQGEPDERNGGDFVRTPPSRSAGSPTQNERRRRSNRMATKEEILDGIANMTVLELSELLK